jgi:hypothetical protein
MLRLRWYSSFPSLLPYMDAYNHAFDVAIQAEETQVFQRAQLAEEKEGEKKQLLAFLNTVEKRQQQDIMLPLQERGLLHQPSTMHARLVLHSIPYFTLVYLTLSLPCYCVMV